MELLKNSGISYEYRTTIVKGLHTPEDILGIGKWIAAEPFAAYYLQSYRENEKSILNLCLRDEENLQRLSEADRNVVFESFAKEEMQAMANILKGLSGMNNRVFLRGID